MAICAMPFVCASIGLPSGPHPPSIARILVTTAGGLLAIDPFSGDAMDPLNGVAWVVAKQFLVWAPDHSKFAASGWANGRPFVFSAGGEVLAGWDPLVGRTLNDGAWIQSFSYDGELMLIDTDQAYPWVAPFPQRGLWLVRADLTGTPRYFGTALGNGETRHRLTPDGQSMWFLSDNYGPGWWKRSLDDWAGHAPAAAAPLGGVTYDPSDDFTQLLFRMGQDYWVMDIATGESHQVTHEPLASTVYDARWSPDGDYIAYLYNRTAGQPGGAVRELRIVDVATGTLRATALAPWQVSGADGWDW